MTMRQALCQVLKDTSIGTHFVVKFTDDQAISLLSGNHIVDSFKVFGECLVKWTDNSTCTYSSGQ